MSLNPILRSVILTLTALVLCLLGVQAQSAAAVPLSNTYTVTGTSDGPGACSEATGGYTCPTLRVAVVAANTNPGLDTIVLKHGWVYSLTIPPAGNDDQTTGDLDILSSLDFTYGNAVCLSNCGAIIQGGSGWSDRLLNIYPNIQVNLSRVTLRYGSNASGLGGAILNRGVLTLTNCLIMHNSATVGGGLYNHVAGTLNLISTRVFSNTAVVSNNYLGSSAGLQNDGRAYLSNSTVDENRAAYDTGGIGNSGYLIISGGVISANFASLTAGGIQNNSGAYPDAQLIMTNTQVLSNTATATGGGGGGLVNAATSLASLTGVTFAFNRVGHNTGLGGGVLNQGTLTLDRVTILTSTAHLGGGVYNTGSLHVYQTTLSGNHSDWGGGLYNGGTASLVNSTVSGNVATFDGGGIGNLDINGLGRANTPWRVNAASLLTITNSTLSGNQAGDNGGGLFNGPASSTNPMVDLNNVTIAGNQADSNNDGTGRGGGVAVVSGTVNLRNTLIGQNSDLSEQAPDCSGTLTSERYNLVHNTAGCTLVGNLVGNVIGQDPLLGPLQANGGDTWTRALLSGSPAINAGNPTTPGSGLAACQINDQRGVIRPMGGRCDIGAFEYGGLFTYLYLPLVLR